MMLTIVFVKENLLKAHKKKDSYGWADIYSSYNNLGLVSSTFQITFYQKR